MTLAVSAADDGGLVTAGWMGIHFDRTMVARVAFYQV